MKKPSNKYLLKENNQLKETIKSLHIAVETYQRTEKLLRESNIALDHELLGRSQRIDTLLYNLSCNMVTIRKLQIEVKQKTTNFIYDKDKNKWDEVSLAV